MKIKTLERKRRKEILLLFGSRATGTFNKESDYDYLYISEKNELPDDIMQLLMKEDKRQSFDTFRLKDFVHCLRIGCPDVLIITEQAVVLRGKSLMKQIRYQNQGITSLTISLCLKKTNKLLKNSREYIKDGFWREAAHRASLSAFWLGAALSFLNGEIPRDKNYVFNLLESYFNLPFSKSRKFSSYDITELEEPPEEEVLNYFKTLLESIRRFYLMAFVEYIKKSRLYFEKARAHFSSQDWDSTIMMAHSAVELAVKGYLIKKTKQAPLYLLEIYRKKKFLNALQNVLGNSLLSKLTKLNKIRNAVYHTVYSPTKQDAEFVVNVTSEVLSKISQN